jgi:Holliday junction resolvase RusA-like endonuclease
VFRKALEHLAANPSRVGRALGEVNKLHILGTPSFASKHLRFLRPDVCPVFDSVLREALPYSFDADGYDRFATDCTQLSDILRARGIENPRERQHGQWFAADVEAALFAHVNVWLPQASEMSSPRARMQVRIAGVPYAQSKTRGRKDGCLEWSEAVAAQTAHLPRLTGPCRLRVTFFLPPDKYPLDHPYGGDLDNLLKRFFDALQRTVFRDVPGKDGCVAEVEARKVKVESYKLAGAQVEIQPL